MLEPAKQLLADPSVLLANAERALRAGNLMAAEFMCRSVIADRHDCSSAYLLLAKVLEAGGHREAAKRSLQEGISAFPGFAEGHLALGRLQRLDGRIAEGQEQATLALQIADGIAVAEPGNTTAHIVIGSAQLELGNVGGAVFALQKALDLVPESATAHGAMASALNAAGRAEEAERHLRRAVAADPVWIAKLFDHLISAGAVTAAARDFKPEFLKINPFDRHLMQVHRKLLVAIDRHTGWFRAAMSSCAENYDFAAESGTGPTAVGPGNKHGPRVILVSFGSAPNFEQAQRQLANSAFANGVTHSLAWSLADLKDTHFYEKYRALLDQPRGAGYWAWKPYICLRAMLAADEGDWILYHDAGWGPGAFSFQIDIHPLLKWIDATSNGLFPGVCLPHFRAREWVKRDCFTLMNCDQPDFWNAPLVSASWSAWRKSRSSIEFLRKWLDCMVDPRISTDFPNVGEKDDFPEFVDHRHDQAVVSLLTRSTGIRYYGNPEHPAFDLPGLHDPGFDPKNINAFIAAISTADHRGVAPPTVTLQKIGLRHGTDKADAVHSHAGKSFLDVYEHYFESLRSRAITILEIGIKNGSSLLTWRDYFPHAAIWGLDIDPTCSVYAGGRVSVVIGSQEDPAIVRGLLDASGGFDVIIDDGSHINEMTIRSFDLLWPGVRPKGLYIIEDLHCTYGDALLNWPGMAHTAARGIDFANRRETFEAFVGQKIRDMDEKRSNVSFIHLYSKTMVFGKGG